MFVSSFETGIAWDHTLLRDWTLYSVFRITEKSSFIVFSSLIERTHAGRILFSPCNRLRRSFFYRFSWYETNVLAELNAKRISNHSFFYANSFSLIFRNIKIKRSKPIVRTGTHVSKNISSLPMCVRALYSAGARRVTIFQHILVFNTRTLRSIKVLTAAFYLFYFYNFTICTTGVRVFLLILRATYAK